MVRRTYVILVEIATSAAHEAGAGVEGIQAPLVPDLFVVAGPSGRAHAHLT
jgi:hypothetical protein